MTLTEKVEARHTAVVVIDVQNDFVDPEGTLAKAGLDVTEPRAMAARVPVLLDAARAAGVLVIHVRNVLQTEANWYLSDVWLEQAARRPRRAICSPESWHGAFYGDVRPLPDEPVVNKHRFDAFHATDLETILRAHGIRTIVFAGVATDVCVETTARNAFVRDYYVVVARDGTATYTTEDHEGALARVDRYFGEVADIADVTAVWRPTEPARERPALTEIEI
jgi:ureidoacrylate peracid hydrolase